MMQNSGISCRGNAKARLFDNQNQKAPPLRTTSPRVRGEVAPNGSRECAPDDRLRRG